MDLDATPYRIFVTVADELSFTRASALLNVSQPALSARIREFERRLQQPASASLDAGHLENSIAQLKRP